MTTELIDAAEDPGDDRPIDWVTVASFTEPTAAHVARIRLEGEDIPCFVADEHIGTALWHYSIATGGIKLQVPRERAAEASAALQSAVPPAIDESDPDLCPRCHAGRVAPVRTARRTTALFFLCLILLGIHPLIGLIAAVAGICFVVTTRARRCNACGAEYQPEPPGFDVLPRPPR